MGHQQHVMTEIALALSMGIFSILILALLAMGTGDGAAPAATLALAAPSSSANAAPARPVPDLLVVFHQGRFLDKDLKPLARADIHAPEGGRVVLAVDPALPLAVAMGVRDQLAGERLVVTTLDKRWIEALARR